MKRYALKYSDKKVYRFGEDAIDAVDKLCDQYGWSFSVNMFDAETRGSEWAECRADKDGGINYRTIILATLEK